jgi:hypothetical protein
MIEPERTRDELKAKMLELIKDKNADQAVVLNTILISLAVPVLEDIVQHLGQITKAIAPDLEHISVADSIRGIDTFLQQWVRPLLEPWRKY